MAEQQPVFPRILQVGLLDFEMRLPSAVERAIERT